jgi:bifunctional non-homologous end joining protein LigD
MGLDEYRRKRREDATNEPFGEPDAQSAETLSGAFVVHLHDATRKHYDLRVEVAGVLASFAVPHGPSLKPLDKHLAIRTEDHPLEYIDFEGVIPDGQYGAGPMIAWDRGVVEYLEGPAEDELARGKLDMMLYGHKLRGRFALVRTKGRPGDASAKQEPWLLIKKADAYADAERDVTAEQPRSVLSGMRVEELARREEVAATLYESGRAAGAERATGLLGGPRPALELAPWAAASIAPDDAVFDPHLDGVRVLATREGDVIRFLAPRADGVVDEVDAFYPELVRALRASSADRLAIDGHIVAFDRSGHPSLELLAKRVGLVAAGEPHRAAVECPVALIADDLLVLGDADLRPVPLEARRRLACALLPPKGLVRAEPPLEGALPAILAFCKEHGVDGVIAKGPRSPYPARRGGVAWSFIDSGAPTRARATVDHSAAHARQALRRVTVTNRGKLFWPELGYTKGDLCDYYAAVADTLLPYLADRPVILVRYPDGIDGKSFFQWNVPVGMPAWVRTLTLDDAPDEHGGPPSASPSSRRSRPAPKPGKRGFLVDDRSTLLYIANLACIPIHVLACRATSLDRADFFTIDFDLEQSTLAHAVTLANTLRELLDAIGLPGFPKTSGQSGLHVLVPLGRGAHGFDTARSLADLLGRMLVDRHPDIATMERVVSKRGARVYVDTGQTGASRAIAAPYSVRAVARATVSTPLSWDEVSDDLDPAAFDLRTVPDRVAKLGDPMRALLGLEPDVPAAISKLSDIVTHLR